MTDPEFRDRLRLRAADASIEVPDRLTEGLMAYIRLLTKWNDRMNLTALSIDPLTDEALDRLILEPLAAVPHVPEGPIVWYDLGSGGGSPALPLALARPQAQLTMVESKSRKSAFLREAIRQLELENARVETARVQDLTTQLSGTANLMTVRALRLDAGIAAAVASMLRPDGFLLLFQGRNSPIEVLPGFRQNELYPLPGAAILSIHSRVPRGTVII